MKKVFFIMLIIVSFYPLQAQKEINGLLNSFVNLNNSLKKEVNSSKIINLYSEQYTGNTTYVNLTGGIIKKTYTINDIKKQLNDILQDDEYHLTISLNKILYSNQKENAGTISALLNFTSHIDEKIAEKGTMLINIIAVNQNNVWKIIQNNIVRISKTKDIGDCICHIYDKGGTKFVTELYYPGGVSYNHAFESFQFTNINKSRLIKTRGEIFQWEKETGIIKSNDKELGIAKKEKEAIKVLIKNNNAEPCQKMIFR